MIRVIRIFRYVGDFLIVLNLHPNKTLRPVADNITTVFTECSKELNFPRELPLDNTIRLPDLRQAFGNDEHLCWMYEPRSKKGFCRLLPRIVNLSNVELPRCAFTMA